MNNGVKVIDEKMVHSVHELDYSLDSLSIRIEALSALQKELGHVTEDVVNTDISSLEDMGLRFMDINHKIVLIDSLLHYLLKDIKKDYETTYELKNDLFNRIVK